MRWRVALEILTVVGDHSRMVRLNVIEGIRQRHIAFLVVMAISLTVGRDVDDLRPRARIREGGSKPAGEVFAFLEQALERDCLRDRRIIEKHSNAPPGG